MNIALIGYGKMGQIIEQLALEAGHAVPLIIDQDNQDELTTENLRRVDVVIEFTRPESAPANILRCLEAGVPVVCGTTGWMVHFGEIEKQVHALEGTLFYASNFSIGVNIFFALNRYLARLMQAQEVYAVAMQEIHHTKKLDAPSGTAITLAQGILDEIPRLESWVSGTVAGDSELPIESIREGEVPGTHVVEYRSAIDTLTIRHEAHGREGFARGAIQAATWVLGKKGVYNMGDLLGLTI